VRKDTLKSCIQMLKPSIEERKDFISTCSPVLLSGSLVKSGEGRMVVLAVGKLSRRGEFVALTRHHREPTHMQLKLEDLTSTVINWLLALLVIYILVLVARLLYQCFTSGDWSNLT
jgi:magnesium-transporting ATPase (P-type)